PQDFTHLIKDAGIRRQWGEALRLIAGLRGPSTGCEANVITFTAAVGVLARCKRWRPMLALLAQMHADALEPSTVTHNAAISGLEHWSSSLEILRGMCRRSIRMDDVTLNSAMSALDRGSQWGLALQVLSHACTSPSVCPDVVTCNTAISCLRSVGRWQMAAELLKEARSWSIEADTITFNSLLDAIRRGGSWESAMEVIFVMRAENLQPDLVTFNSGMSALDRGHAWQSAFMLFEDMKMQRTMPDVVTMSVVAGACARSELWREAVSLLDELEEQHLQPGIVMLSTAMRALTSASHWTKALSIFTRLRDGPGQPALDLIAYDAAVSSCGAGMQPEAALKLFWEARGRGLRLDVAICSNVMAALDKGGRWAAALALNDWAPTCDLAGAPIRCSAASAAGSAGLWQLSLYLAVQPGSSSKAPLADAATCCAAINAAGRSQRWQHGLALLDDLRLNSKGHALSIAACNAALTACGRCHEWQRVLTLLQEAGGWGVEVDAVTFNAALDTCSREESPTGGWNRAISLMRAMRARLVQPTEVSLGACLSACERSGGRWVEALATLAAGNVLGLVTTSGSTNAAASACAKAAAFGGSGWRRALSLLFGAPWQSSPDQVGYSVAILSCAESAQWDIALELLHGASADGPPLDVDSLGTLLAECEQRGLQLREDFLLLRLGSSVKGCI
ncbi:unnamed protein product, partial [Polarella glacialis]